MKKIVWLLMMVVMPMVANAAFPEMRIWRTRMSCFIVWTNI